MPPSVISGWRTTRPLPDATGSTYTLVAADEGKTIKVKVSFADDANNLETLTSGATAAVAARSQQSGHRRCPAISGTAQVGETLTADTTGIADADGLTNVSFSYQWIRSDGNTDTDIAGDATELHLHAVRARRRGQDHQGQGCPSPTTVNNADTLTSEATGAVSCGVTTVLATGLPTMTAGTRETQVRGQR